MNGNASSTQHDNRKWMNGDVTGSSDRLVHGSGQQQSTTTNHSALYGLTCKVMLIGDSGAGKSCLLTRYADNTFNQDTPSTVGIDFRTKAVCVDGVTVKLQIWDTAGQERYRTITRAYYRDAQALLLVYDVSSELSLINVQGWLSDIGQYARSNICIGLVGNKSDLESSGRRVRYEDGKRLADDHSLTTFFETSAKTGENVSQAFLTLARHWSSVKAGSPDKELYRLAANKLMSLSAKNNGRTASNKFHCCS